MKVYEDIKSYFLNSNGNRSDYSNQFYIRKLGDEQLSDLQPELEFLEPHKRDFFEIGIIEKHDKNMKIGDQAFDKMTNGLAIVSPFQTISYGKYNSMNRDEGYVIHFKASIFESVKQSYELQDQFPFFKMHTLPLYYLSTANFAEIYSLAEGLYQETKSNQIHSLEIVRSLLLILLFKVKRITHKNEGMVTLNRFDAILLKFENSIQANNPAFLSVNEYASKLNISPIYLSECVKKATGKSAQKIIIDYKVLHGKTLLHQNELEIAQISDALNFNEVANFNQFFKRNVGITASQFRKQERA